MSLKNSIWALVACAALFVGSALGQGTSGAISGTVTDPQGAVVPGAQLTIKNLNTGLVRQVLSDAAGFYRVVGLPPGSYEVRIEHRGFNTEVRTGLTLTVAEEAVVPFSLRVRAIAEEVRVIAEAVGVETAVGMANWF